MNKTLAWHFLRDDCKMRFKPEVMVKPDVEYKAELPLSICKNGLHASEQIIDALFYAPGPVVCRVELSGEIIKSDDKICAEKRKVLWMYNAANVLHEFACIVAEQALLKERESGREPDPCSWRAIEVKRRWLNGESSSEDLAAARTAAMWAALRATWAAEVAAAWSASKAAVSKAVGAASRAAAYAETREIAWAAITKREVNRVAEAKHDAHNALLESMIIKAYK